MTAVHPDVTLGPELTMTDGRKITDSRRFSGDMLGREGGGGGGSCLICREERSAQGRGEG